MKKLLALFVVCFLTAPLFAFYNEGEVVKVKVWNGQWEMGEDGLWRSGVEEIELTCKAPQALNSYPTQGCFSEDDMTKLFLDEYKGTPSVNYEIESLKVMKEAADGDFWVSGTIPCPQDNTSAHPYVELHKFLVREDAPEGTLNPGYVCETLAKTDVGTGRIALLRYYKPEGGVNAAERRNFKLFDVHRLTEADQEAGVETDFTRLCTFPYPGAPDTKTKE